MAGLIIALGRADGCLLRPARSGAKWMIAAIGDLTRMRPELIADNALLRQQLIGLRRSIERPRLRHDHRLLVLILARLTRRWARRLTRRQPRDAAALASRPLQDRLATKVPSPWSSSANGRCIVYCGSTLRPTSIVPVRIKGCFRGSRPAQRCGRFRRLLVETSSGLRSSVGSTMTTSGRRRRPSSEPVLTSCVQK